MLLNVSYNKPKIKSQIDESVGKAFSFKDRIKLGGIGSGKLIIESTNQKIHNLLVLDNHRNVCNIEMRPQGIILNFKSLLETYALVIPYRKLHIYKEKSEQYSIYMDEYFVKIKANEKHIHKFMRKILDYKLSISGLDNNQYYN
ncbi:hypothetical protein [Flavobacterium sp. CS20]|uniref:hypothetical protein n=1 Tax=Flavobacterium sp. CS20 TaxID=2775246 RepID=UPI001B39E97E|nr:hypothetical protein [Flavobacterium sp. CS20]QTY27119.1 hypothetical protein IGB25_00460 [Flavobacterium sp. CS20]